MRRSRQPVTPRSSRKRRRRRIGALLGSVVLIVVIGGVRWRRDRLEFVMLLDEHTGTTLRRLPHNASLVGETESSGLWADGSKAPGFDNGALQPAGVTWWNSIPVDDRGDHGSRGQLDGDDVFVVGPVAPAQGCFSVQRRNRITGRVVWSKVSDFDRNRPTAAAFGSGPPPTIAATVRAPTGAGQRVPVTMQPTIPSASPLTRLVIPVNPRPDGTNTCAPVDALMIGTDTIAVAAQYRTMLFDRDTGTALATTADSVPAPKLLAALLVHADWNRVIAHDVRTGALRWAQPIATDPTLAGAGPQLEFTTTLLNPPVLIVTSPTTATAFETSGTKRWSVRFPGWINTKVTVTDDAIIVATIHRIIAIDSANGITRWSHSFTGPRSASVVAVRTHHIAAVRLDRWRSDD